MARTMSCRIYDGAVKEAAARSHGQDSQRKGRSCADLFFPPRAPQTPQEAINGTYIDKKCPFTGEVSIRGRILTGRVVSTKMTRTIIIRREYLHFVPKYSRYEKRCVASSLCTSKRTVLTRVSRSRTGIRTSPCTARRLSVWRSATRSPSVNVVPSPRCVATPTTCASPRCS